MWTRSRSDPAQSINRFTRADTGCCAGDPVDGWHEGGWWEGFVFSTFDDHISIFFPGGGLQLAVHALVWGACPRALAGSIGAGWAVLACS